MIDWLVVATIAAPTIALFVGILLNRWLESRPLLISYYGHVAAFRHTAPQGQALQVFTHSVVLRNAGRRAATNVRLLHRALPDFLIQPPVEYTVRELPEGMREILIPQLVPGEQLVISYLYFPPLTYADINASIKSDQGFAREIPVLLQRQYPTWIGVAAGVSMLCGVVAIFYVLYIVLRRS